MIPAEKHKDDRADDSYDDPPNPAQALEWLRQKENSNAVVAVATIVIAIAAVLGFIVSVLQWRAISGQVTLMEQQLEGTEAARIEILNENLERSFTSPRILHLAFFLVNLGHVTAPKAEGSLRITRRRPTGEAIGASIPWNINDIGPFPPTKDDERKYGEFTAIELLPGEIAQLNSAGEDITIEGQISFLNGFSPDPKTLLVCFSFLPDSPTVPPNTVQVQGGFAPCARAKDLLRDKLQH